MKVVLYILGFILFLVLFFFSLGLIKPQQTYGHEMEVSKSIEEAWNVHQDVTKFDQWLKGFQSIEHLSGEAGAVGSKYKVTVKPEPDQPDFIMTQTILELKEFDHMTYQMDSDMMKFEQTVSFSEKDGKTIVKTDSKVDGNGIFMKSMFSFMDIFLNSFQKQEEENYNNLKKVIEENRTNYNPKQVIEEEMPEGNIISE